MYERILIATDGSELAGKGLAHGLTLAAALRVPVLVVTVTEPWMPAFDDALALSADPAMQAQYREGCSRSAQRILQDAAAQAAGFWCFFPALLVSPFLVHPMHRTGAFMPARPPQ